MTKRDRGTMIHYADLPTDDTDTYDGPPLDDSYYRIALPTLLHADVDHSWRVDSLCAVAGHNFFDMGKANQEESKRLCNEECTVRDQCLNFALNNREDFGVWGGYNPEERRALIKERSRVAQ